MVVDGPQLATISAALPALKRVEDADEPVSSGEEVECLEFLPVEQLARCVLRPLSAFAYALARTQRRAQGSRVGAYLVEPLSVCWRRGRRHGVLVAGDTSLSGWPFRSVAAKVKAARSGLDDSNFLGLRV